MDGLNDCPFCGSSAFTETRAGGFWMVLCNGCPASIGCPDSGYEFSDRADAVKFWNKRSNWRFDEPPEGVFILCRNERCLPFVAKLKNGSYFDSCADKLCKPYQWRHID